MAGLQQTYLFSVLGHTCGQGLNDWDLLQEKTKVKTKQLKGLYFVTKALMPK